jgi:hypothetical protein
VKEDISPSNSKGIYDGKKESKKEAHQRFVDKERVEFAEEAFPEQSHC